MPAVFVVVNPGPEIDIVVEVPGGGSPARKTGDIDAAKNIRLDSRIDKSDQTVVIAGAQRSAGIIIEVGRDVGITAAIGNFRDKGIERNRGQDVVEGFGVAIQIE